MGMCVCVCAGEEDQDYDMTTQDYGDYNATFDYSFYSRSKTSIYQLSIPYTIDQGSPNYGPRAEHGPPTHLDRPSEQCQRHILKM